MAERSVEIDGRRLQVRLVGAGPAVVLEQGGGAPGVGGWPGIEENLAEHATVLTYDRAGLGASDPPARRPTARDMARDLCAVLDTCLPDQPVTLVGFSLGGLVTALLASQQPQRIAGLVLVDPTSLDAYEGKPRRLVDPATVLVTAFRLLSAATLARPLVRRYASAQLGPSAPAPVREQMSQALCSPRFWAGVRLETARLRQSCQQVALAMEEAGLPDVPVRVLTAGERTGTALRTRDSHRALASRAPNGRLVIVEGARHNVVALRPDAVVQAVLEVIGNRSPGQAR